jgi:hypothetical protein
MAEILRWREYWECGNIEMAESCTDESNGTILIGIAKK